MLETIAGFAFLLSLGVAMIFPAVACVAAFKRSRRLLMAAAAVTVGACALFLVLYLFASRVNSGVAETGTDGTGLFIALGVTAAALIAGGFLYLAVITLASIRRSS